MMDLEYLSWKDLYMILLSLSETVKRSFKPSLIVAILKGGVVPAIVISDLLGVDRVLTIRFRHYVDIGVRGVPTLCGELNGDVAGEAVLIVDDIADTGVTLKNVKEKVNMGGVRECKTLTVYSKPWSNPQPDFYGRMTENWVVFPWEIGETVRKLYKKYLSEGKSLNDLVADLVGVGVRESVVTQVLSLGEN